ncbi:PilN domain-containing protein [Desulfofalx alkaliphila]|uniref:PilN domain-containing protein n=1 Tax=Desulfofalx alkaliphila TaxID=105483 RepID=UPI0004E14434|nr:PilN domain-containing protein [Desulfofalx alkaliphila]
MKNKVNLLPKKLQPQAPLKLSRLCQLTMIVVVFAAILMAYAVFSADLNNKREMLPVMQKELDALLLIGERMQQTGDTNQVPGLLANKIKWHQVLADIKQGLPGGVWLTEVNLIEHNLRDAKGQLVIKGSGERLSSIGLYIHNLQQLPYIGQAELVNSRLNEQHDTMEFIIHITFPESGDEI